MRPVYPFSRWLQCVVTEAPGIDDIEQIPCAAGTIAATRGLGVCELCAGGTYQNSQGATECFACREGHYCPTGAAAALRCHCYEFLLVYHAESGRATPVFLVLLKEVARLDM